jgi:HJR/Mrr/RecB family endonuclease
LYETVSVASAVIFCNKRQKVDWLAEKLAEREFTVSFMVRLCLSDIVLNTATAR